MVNRRSILAVILATSLAGSASAAFARTAPGTRPATTNPIASRVSVEWVASLTVPISFGSNLLDLFRTLRGSGRVGLPVRDTGPHTESIQDGPDSWDPVGVKGRGMPSGGPSPANTPVR